MIGNVLRENDQMRKNPNDPQADAVREKLRRQGLID